MFYITKFMREAVYYSEAQQAYVIAELEGDILYMQNVF